MSVEATYGLLYQTMRDDELVADFRALWEGVKVSLPDEAATYTIAKKSWEVSWE